jgi:PAX-interacting protein 1
MFDLIFKNNLTKIKICLFQVLIQQQQIQQSSQAQATTQQQAVQQIAQQLQSQTEGAVIGQSQVLGQQGSQPGTPQPQQVQPQWVPQSPTQQNPQNIPGQGTPQSPIVQQIITTPAGHIARNVRPRYMYLDATSSMQFARMDKQQKQEYIEQRGVLMGPQIAFQARPNAQTGPRHIVIHNAQVNRSQQIQWIQGQGGQVVRVQTAGTPGLAPITAQQVQAGQANVTPVQFQIDPNATPQQQQMQIQMQRQQIQLQRIQQLKQAGAGGEVINPNFQVMDPNVAGGDQGLAANKTKTALANMLSNRLSGNGNVVVPIVEQNMVEPSAAGTLRMMTAQHNALNANQAVRTPQELLVIQQQQQQVQLANQRRTLGNITNATPVPNVVPGPITPGTPVIVPQSPGSIKGQPPFSPGRVPLPRPQFYGHNPNLKLPSELFLLGCHFLIVEYDETHKEDLPAWKQTIKHHGGEIESCYNPKVTHILCRTQRHGIVMQAIRDNKRCVTAYWLMDCVGKKQVLPPWQAIHLPSPSVFGPLKPGHKHIIAITAFEGEERERVMCMVEETGARYTNYLNRQNTVLVCKRIDPQNRKYVRAKEVNIPCVNVVWLSDLLLGNTSATLQYESSKYQQYALQAPLRIDYTIVSHLMSMEYNLTF